MGYFDDQPHIIITPSKGIDPAIVDWYAEHGEHKEYAKGSGEVIGFISAEQQMRELQRFVLGFKLAGMQEARAAVITRTEIPKDAKNPTRDATVIIGEACAEAIDRHIENLKHRINGGPTVDEDYPSNTNKCNSCGTQWGTAPGGTPPIDICPSCGSDNVSVNV